MWYRQTMENYSAIKKENILPFVATWMDFKGIQFSSVQFFTRQLCLCVLRVSILQSFKTNLTLFLKLNILLNPLSQ